MTKFIYSIPKTKIKAYDEENLSVPLFVTISRKTTEPILMILGIVYTFYPGKNIGSSRIAGETTGKTSY